MRIARKLEAEWRQVLRGNVGTGAKEVESIVGWVTDIESMVKWARQ
jgi:hypothetical protein